MKRRFPGGVTGLLEALRWIQLEAATGALGPIGGSAGRLVFRDGILLLVEGLAASAPEGGSSLREQACGRIEDWSFGDSLLVFQGGDEPGQPPGEAGKLTAADLILDLVRRNVDPRWVARRLAEASGNISNPKGLPRVLPGVSMTPTEAFLLSRADGSMSIEEILQVSPLDPTDVKLGLYALLATGLLAAPGVVLPGSGTDRGEVEVESAPPPADGATAPTPGSESSERATVGDQPALTEQEPGVEGPPPAGPLPPASVDAGEAVVLDPSPRQPASAASRSVLDLEAFLARTGTDEKPPSPPAPVRPQAPVSDEPSAAAQPGGAAPAAVPAASAGAAPPSGRAMSELEQERAGVLEWIASRTGADYYSILKVDRSADEEAVRRAYYRVAKRFHPDRFRREGFEGLLQDVERMFAATTEAYNTLSDDVARTEYEREIAARSRGSKGSEGDAAAQARESYQRARKHAEAEEYFDAAALLEGACRMDGSRAEYWLLLGTVQSKNPRWRKKAEESYQKVIALNPASADAHLHLARLYKAGGLTKRAQEMYRKVVQWDPQNEEALAVLSGKDDGQGAGVGGKLRSIFKGSRS